MKTSDLHAAHKHILTLAVEAENLPELDNWQFIDTVVVHEREEVIWTFLSVGSVVTIRLECVRQADGWVYRIHTYPTRITNKPYSGSGHCD